MLTCHSRKGTGRKNTSGSLYYLSAHCHTVWDTRLCLTEPFLLFLVTPVAFLLWRMWNMCQFFKSFQSILPSGSRPCQTLRQSLGHKASRKNVRNNYKCLSRIRCLKVRTFIHVLRFDFGVSWAFLLVYFSVFCCLSEWNNTFYYAAFFFLHIYYSFRKTARLKSATVTICSTAKSAVCSVARRTTLAAATWCDLKIWSFCMTLSDSHFIASVLGCLETFLYAQLSLTPTTAFHSLKSRLWTGPLKHLYSFFYVAGLLLSLKWLSCCMALQ